MVAWEALSTPKWAGGLGVPNLKWLNIAMQARWPWLQRTDASKPWAEFEIQVPEKSKMLCAEATCSIIGNGMSTLFWEDRWLGGFRVQELAPSIYESMSRSARNSRTVHQALSTAEWARDVGPELSSEALNEYMGLWAQVTRVDLNPDAVDAVSWVWEPDGRYSCRSAYRARFWGREVSPTAVFTWSSKAPLRCRFFTWLAVQSRCWTAD